jgi:hypothetical protein
MDNVQKHNICSTLTVYIDIYTVLSYYLFITYFFNTFRNS